MRTSGLGLVWLLLTLPSILVVARPHAKDDPPKPPLIDGDYHPASDDGCMEQCKLTLKVLVSLTVLQTHQLSLFISSVFPTRKRS